jgi:hypothetical protein
VFAILYPLVKLEIGLILLPVFATVKALHNFYTVVGSCLSVRFGTHACLKLHIGVETGDGREFCLHSGACSRERHASGDIQVFVFGFAVRE